MVGVGYLVELLFGATMLIPAQRLAKVMAEGITWNYTTWLNIAFLILAAVLVARFVRTGGIAMLAMMGGSPDAQPSTTTPTTPGTPHPTDENPLRPATTTWATTTTDSIINGMRTLWQRQGSNVQRGTVRGHTRSVSE
jgi:hypothetical protein